MLITQLIGIAIIACPKVIIINETNTWTIHDNNILETSKNLCKKKYVNYPCLKKFWKKEELIYWVLCGKV